MALLSYHSARRGFLGFLTYITGSDSISRGGVIPAFVQVDSAGAEAPAGTAGNPIFVSGASGGGAATIADGADVAEGATTDAVVAAGAAGTVSAKLRRLTTDLDAFKTATHTDLIAATPAGSNLIGKVGIDQTTPGTTNLVADSGKYNATKPTLADGNRGDVQLGTRGALVTQLQLPDNANPVGFAGSGSDAVANNTINAYNSFTFSSVFNGTTWDRAKKPNVYARLLSSAATTNATSVKATPGDVFKFTGNNTTATKRYLKFYNKASAPTVGTDTPILTFPLLGSAAFDISITQGAYFSTGIAYAITGAAADADTTAVSAGDIECLNILYA
jgi:hypothetical protein